MKHTSHALILSVTMLLLASLACSVFVGGPDFPAQPIPVSQSDVDNMHAQIEQAFTAGAETGEVTLQITEVQLTSYLGLRTQAMDHPPFTDPQVLLRNNQMQLYGRLQSGVFSANMLIIMNVGIDATSGLPAVTVTEADFGPIPAPHGIDSAINSLIAEAFTGSFGPVATGFRMENISIADGVMTITGRIK